MKKTKAPGTAGARTPRLKRTTQKKNDNANLAAVQSTELIAALKRRRVTTLQARREIKVLHSEAQVTKLRRASDLIQTFWSTVVTAEGNIHEVAAFDGDAKEAA